MRETTTKGADVKIGDQVRNRNAHHPGLAWMRVERVHREYAACRNERGDTVNEQAVIVTTRIGRTVVHPRADIGIRRATFA